MNLTSLLLSSVLDNSLFNNNGIENISVDKNGDATKIYSDLINNSLSAEFQPRKQKHKDYKVLGLIDLGSLYPEDLDK